MSVMAERVAITVEDFEEIARVAYKLPDRIRLEFINGRISSKSGPISAENFDVIARAAEKLPVPVRLELLNGRIEVKAVPDGDHSEIIGWLIARCIQSRPDLRVFVSEFGLEIPAYRKGRARPDLVLAPSGTFAGQGEWADPRGAVMVAEVTSWDADTERRDRREKPVGYGEAGIPVFLLIDRGSGTVTVYSSPGPDGYEAIDTVEFGTAVILPDPVGIDLYTEELKNYVR